MFSDSIEREPDWVDKIIINGDYKYIARRSNMK